MTQYEKLKEGRVVPEGIEIPQGKRKLSYRLLEILPFFLSVLLVALLFIFSLIHPVLGSIYLLLMTAATLVKAFGVAYRTIQGYNTVTKAERVDWHKRVAELANAHEMYERYKGEASDEYGFREHIYNLKAMAAEPKDYPAPTKIYHAVLVMAYNEGIDILAPSIQAVADNTFDAKKVILVLGYEERGGEKMEETAKALKKRFRGVFYDFLLVKHPDGLKGEIVGKGPNLCYAGQATYDYVVKKKIPVENVMVTSLDADNKMSPNYLDAVTYAFITHKNRQNVSYQPVAIFTNNIWEASAPMRVIALSNSFFNVISTVRPHVLRNFASHSQPLLALNEMNYWSKRTIVEDGHQYWRSLFHFRGRYDVVPIRVTIGQDAVMGDGPIDTLKAQFVQLRRWDYGASDVAYVGVKLFSKKYRKMKFSELFPKFMRLLDGHVMLAVMAPIVAFGGWVPMLLNQGSRFAVAFTLPVVVGWIQTFAMVGLIATIWTSMKMLPPRPAGYSKKRTLLMVVQWGLMPVVALVYQSAAAFYAQFRLATGNYMEKFDVTKKVRKS